ncbi:MAG: cytochrome-c peroxidase [Hydrogenophilales bacterium]|nr:cytochrome-c peroxidase [Hydrogenophilales bacterium]
MLLGFRAFQLHFCLPKKSNPHPAGWSGYLEHRRCRSCHQFDYRNRQDSLRLSIKLIAFSYVVNSYSILDPDQSIYWSSCPDIQGAIALGVPFGHDWQQDPINSPTVLNSSMNLAQFWDGRAKDLKAQAGGPIANLGEMAFTHEPSRMNWLSMC